MFTTNAPSGFPGAAWNQPLALTHDYLSLRSWMELAKKLEEAKFDCLFWADHSGVYDAYEGRRDASVRWSVQFPINDPSALISALASSTQNLGFAFSANVIQEHPFSFARRVGTLDHLTEGRVAWNIVTSFQRSAWRNVGFEELADHGERYERASEYVDVVYKLLEGSWSDEAVIRDVESGIYAEPQHVRPVDHVGRFYRSAGPGCVEPSPQRLPVLFQAGTSDDGRRFSARHAEALFIAARNKQGIVGYIQDMTEKIKAEGRRREDVLVFQYVSCIAAKTEDDARRKADALVQSTSDEARLAFSSATIDVDLSTVDLDTPIGELETNAFQGMLRALADAAPNRRWTFRQLVGGPMLPHVVGTGAQIADYIEDMASTGVDGVNIAFLNGVGELDDFARYAVPELQRRGLMQSEYKSGPLREKWFGERTVNSRHPAAQYRR